MTNHSTRTPSVPPPRIGVAALVLGFTLASACGNLDEQDSLYPSVLALTRWDATHVLALRANYSEPVVLELAAGNPTGKLGFTKYYQDIESLDDGSFAARHNQSIDFIDAEGRIKNAIPGHVFIGAVVSLDRSTLAYADFMDAQESFIGVTSLRPATVLRYSPAGLHMNITPEGLALSRDGTILAYVQGSNVVLARTDAPSGSGQPATLPTCTLDPSPDTWGSPVALAMSPVDNRLAVASGDGWLRIFDAGQYPSCPMLVKVPAVPPLSSPLDVLLRYSPSGTMLAVAVSQSDFDPASGVATWTNEVRLFDANTGAGLAVLPVGHEEAPASDSAARVIADVLWSDAGDRLTVAGQFILVQHWDLATGTLLWSTKL